MSGGQAFAGNQVMMINPAVVSIYWSIRISQPQFKETREDPYKKIQMQIIQSAQTIIDFTP